MSNPSENINPSSPSLLDKKYLWHPFTPIDEWVSSEFDPIVITSGEGATLTDTQGNQYLDGNSSIWTNLHGHSHPSILQALEKQLSKICHSSSLGLTNDQAPLLAQQLCQLASPSFEPSLETELLTRCFLSDNGSTAMETALKMVTQFFQQNGEEKRKKFISLSSSYHGDTVGAMSIANSSAFHHNYQHLLFETTPVMSPFCYRCPYNQAKPEKADARTYRKCNFECVDEFEKTLHSQKQETAAWVIEPRVQTVAGFVMHPEGYLEKTAQLAQESGVKVILDEVMTGFYRTGSLFAFQKENIDPDFIALAKGITNGTLPLAATLTTEEIFNGFRGSLDRTFFHGHSYNGNQLGCAAAIENLNLLQEKTFSSKHSHLTKTLKELSKKLWNLKHVGDVRQEGSILAIELVRDPETRTPFHSSHRVGYHVCQQAKEYQLLTRPVYDVLILMPPYCTTDEQLEQMVDALYYSILDTI